MIIDAYCDKCERDFTLDEDEVEYQLSYGSFDDLVMILAAKIKGSKWEEEKLIQALQDYINPNIGIYDSSNK